MWLAFYFSKQVVVDQGMIGSYDEDLQLHSPINTPRVYIDKDNGNMGIGTHTPSSGKLQVQDGGIAVRGAATPNINFSPTDGNSGNGDISFDGNDLKIISNSSGANVRIGAYSKLNHIVIKANGHIGIHTDNPSNSTHLTIAGTSNYEAGIFYKQANVNQYRFMCEGGTGNVYYDVYGISGGATGDHIFRTKVSTIKESYFGKKEVKKDDEIDNVAAGESAEQPADLSNAMAAYSAAISKTKDIKLSK